MIACIGVKTKEKQNQRSKILKKTISSVFLTQKLTYFYSSINGMMLPSVKLCRIFEYLMRFAAFLGGRPNVMPPFFALWLQSLGYNSAQSSNTKLIRGTRSRTRAFRTSLNRTVSCWSRNYRFNRSPTDRIKRCLCLSVPEHFVLLILKFPTHRKTPHNQNDYINRTYVALSE